MSWDGSSTRCQTLVIAGAGSLTCDKERKSEQRVSEIEIVRIHIEIIE